MVDAFQEWEEVFEKAGQEGAIETWLCKGPVFSGLVLVDEGPSGFFVGWEEDAEECEA